MKVNIPIVDIILIGLMHYNLTYEFQRAHTFYYNPKNIYARNHVHRGYIVKDVIDDYRLTKFWTYKLNKSIRKRIKVNFN